MATKPKSNEENITFNDFLIHINKLYVDNRIAPDKITEINYKTQNGNLSLYVTPINNNVRIVEVKIDTKINNLTKLLSNLNGNLTASYDGTNLDDIIPEQDRPKIIDNKFQLNDNLMIYVMDDLESSNKKIIKKVVSQKPDIKNGELIYTPTNFNNGLNYSSLTLLAKANHINIENNFYVDNDPQKPLIYHGTNIIKSIRNKISWQSSIYANNKQVLVDTIVQYISTVVDMISSDFNESSLEECKITTKEPYVG